MQRRGRKPGKVEKLGPLRTIPYSEFKKYLARHEVAEVTQIRDQ